MSDNITGITIVTPIQRIVKDGKKTDVLKCEGGQDYFIYKDIDIPMNEKTRVEIEISSYKGKQNHFIKKILPMGEMAQAKVQTRVQDAPKTAVKVENKPEKAVDWEKVNTGKVRFHFSIEAFKLWCSLNHDKIQCGLNSELIAQIRTWTSFVMQDAIEDSNLDTPDNDGTEIPF